MENTPIEKLSLKEARLLLNNYLKEGSIGLKSQLNEFEYNGIKLDYSFNSIPGLVEWISSKLITVKKDVDYSLPDWIRNTHEYTNGLYDFSDESNVLLLRLSFYIGECFVKNYPQKLYWDVGKRGMANKNRPVISGFINNMEMVTFHVTNVVVRRNIEGEDKIQINRFLESWISKIPD